MAYAMNEFLSGLSDDDRPKVDPTWRRTVINLTQVLICRSRDIAWADSKRPEDADVRIESASMALEQMQTGIETYGLVPDADQGVLRNAQKRFDEVTERVEALTLSR